MTRYCPNCGEKLKEDDIFCGSCGGKVSKKNDSFLNRYAVLVIAFIIISAIFLSANFMLHQTQIVKVDNVEFELPSDYVRQPA